MKIRPYLLGAFLAVSGTLLVQGCTSAKPLPKICTPGNNVACSCIDLSVKGTHVCNTSGDGFDGPCRINATLLCDEVAPDAGFIDNDTCPGRKVSIGAGTQVISEDTSAGARDDFKGAGVCVAGDGAPDHVYTVTATATGQLDIEVSPDATFDPVLYVGEGACDPAATDTYQCANAAAMPGVREITTIGVIAGKQYTVVVDGAAGASKAGQYALTLKLTPGSFCGDGKVDQGEACDDGNSASNDGCSGGCKNVDGDPPLGNTCPGQAVHLWKTGAKPLTRVTGKGSTDSAKYPKAANQWQNTGSACTVSASTVNISPDRVYAVTTHDSGTLVVNANAQFKNVMIVVRTSCDMPESQAFCANTNGAVTTLPAKETLSFAVTKGTTYYIAVDGVLGAVERGDFDVSFELQ
jgi:cysteine-rich repeat protein